MLRRCVRRAARPYGPLGQTLGGHTWTKEQRSEQEMTRLSRIPESLGYGDVRWLHRGALRKARYQRDLSVSWHSVPRDNGELPRIFLMKVLLMNQPILPDDLWVVLKEFNDVPFESKEHMEETIRFALHHGWVYKEKNQTNGKFYLYVAKTRVRNIQQLLRQEESERRRKQLEEERAREAAAQKQKREKTLALDLSIEQLQKQLLANVCKIREFDPDYVADLPFVTQSGGINYMWYRQEKGGGRDESKQQQVPPVS